MVYVLTIKKEEIEMRKQEKTTRKIYENRMVNDPFLFFLFLFPWCLIVEHQAIE
jgi:hypothetical protein